MTADKECQTGGKKYLLADKSVKLEEKSISLFVGKMTADKSVKLEEKEYLLFVGK